MRYLVVLLVIAVAAVAGVYFVRRRGEQPRAKAQRPAVFVGFILDGKEYGIDIDAMGELIHNCAVTEAVGAPDFVVGMVNRRGQSVPVIDLRERLSLGSRGTEPPVYSVVVSVGKPVAFSLDEVTELVEVDPPALAAVGFDGLVKQVRTLDTPTAPGREVRVLDLTRLLTPDELSRL